MYAPITAKSGAETVSDWASQFGVEAGPDGLTLITEKASGQEVRMPHRLSMFLTDLRLLRGVPVSYLVPDVALLPPESIRFFQVDPTWIDRIIDGVLSAANTGTTDFFNNCGLIALVRKYLDQVLVIMAKSQVPGTTWNVGKAMTGLLIRSELVRRWPDLLVSGYEDPLAAQPMPVLRSEPISRDLYIALFAGRPELVQLREPSVGLRFGVELKDESKPTYKVDKRTPIGGSGGSSLDVIVSNRKIDIAALAGQHGIGSSRMIALHLEQRAYVQDFKAVSESRGSIELPTNVSTVALRKGRSINLDSLKARRDQAMLVEGD